MSQNQVLLRYKGKNGFQIKKEDMMDKKDLDLTFSSGGEDELEYAMEIYGQPLLRYCHNILCDYAEAQDVVQITFIKAYRNRQSFKKGTTFSPWLYRIAYTTCMDSLRKRRWSIFEYSTKSNQEYMSQDLQQALLTLSGVERALIFSRIIDEKSYTELEEIYHVPASTLRKRYERAKNKLAKTLRETNTYYRGLEEHI